MHGDASAVNGHHSHVHDHSTAPNPGLSNASKKGKMKKTTDPNEASKLIAAKISQLELDAAGEKDQEAEIGASSCLHCYAVGRPTMHDLPPALHQPQHCLDCSWMQSHNMRQITFGLPSEHYMLDFFNILICPADALQHREGGQEGQSRTQ